MAQQSVTIIGLTGRRGRGKDTVASHVSQFCVDKSIPCFVTSFGEPIRSLVTTLFVEDGASYERNKELKDDVIGYTRREVAQRTGDFCRSLGDVLVARVRKVITTARSLAAEFKKPVVVVLSDVRMPQECDFVHEQHGQVWRITGPDWRRGTSEATTSRDAADEHVTETSVDTLHIDLEVGNTSTKDDLKQAIHRELQDLFA